WYDRPTWKMPAPTRIQGSANAAARTRTKPSPVATSDVAGCRHQSIAGDVLITTSLLSAGDQRVGAVYSNGSGAGTYAGAGTSRDTGAPQRLHADHAYGMRSTQP